MNMKKWIFKVMALVALTAAFASCKDEEGEKVVPAPTVELTPGETSTTSLSFTVIPTNAVKCSWYCEEKTENSALLPASEIFSKGTALEEVKTQVVTVSGLKADTEYVISAAVENEVGEQAAVEELLTIRTVAEQETTTGMKVEISDVVTTVSSITLTVTSKNAEFSAYTWEEIVDGVFPDYNATDVVSKGKKLESNNETVTIEGLKDNTRYMLYAACEAADSYDRVMTKLEVTTKALDAPTEIIEQKFSEVEFKHVVNGKNNVLAFTNNDYTLNLVLVSNDENKYKPFIPAHEYKYEKNGVLNDWSITTLSNIISKDDGTEIDFEKGSVDVKYENGTYTITGSLITVENKEFRMTFEGEIPYIIKTSLPVTATLEKQGTNSIIVIPVQLGFQELKLNISGDDIAGGFTEGQNIETTLVLPEKQEYNMDEGSVSIISKGEEQIYYNITGNLITEDGYKIVLKLIENITIEEPEEPGEGINIVFTEVKATAQEFGGYDGTDYYLTLSNADWMLNVYFNDFYGTASKLPTAKIYISEAGVELKNNKTNEKYDSSQFEDLDQIVISETAKGYKIELKNKDYNYATIKGLGKVAATYEGPVTIK